MAGNLPPSGVILRLREVCERRPQEMTGKSVRVMGKLASHNVIQRQAAITSAERNDQQSRLNIDTKLIEPFDARLGSIFQFIGELEISALSGELVLCARVVQCIDGIDVAMYYNALDLQREYLESSRNELSAGAVAR
ncbi:uncharacterized protein [Amphiura filiformis]|uniref:uncharacterized protein n=1 Tax=Amphiura filiformis TaxID=82378 RepID=UPI003B22564B